MPDGRSVERGENRHPEDGAGFAAAGRRDLQIEEVQNSVALERASARDGVVAGLITARTARALSNVQRRAQAGAVELVGEFGPLQREPTDHVRSEGESKSVRVPQGQAARSKR